ncbi:hypothetical protein HZS_514 [Henneguya salminicola]|nr:hypothetical protein HZS_514 [Henneguya salminicola]
MNIQTKTIEIIIAQMIFQKLLCLIALTLHMVYGPTCIYKLKDPDGDHFSQKIAKAGVNMTILNQYSFKRRNKTNGDCYSINSSWIKPQRLFMSFLNNTDGKYCCGQQIMKCRFSRLQNSTTHKDESGEAFVKRVLKSCTNMTGYVSLGKCRSYDIINEIQLVSNSSIRTLVEKCNTVGGFFTSWGQEVIIEEGRYITIDVLNQTIYL